MYVTAAEPYPPTDLVIEVDGLNLVATWTEPFSLEGEELSYFISIRNIDTGAGKEVNATMPSYVFTEPIGERDCAVYGFTVFSRNDFSKSNTAVSRREKIPTGEVYSMYNGRNFKDETSSLTKPNSDMYLSTCNG